MKFPDLHSCFSPWASGLPDPFTCHAFTATYLSLPCSEDADLSSQRSQWSALIRLPGGGVPAVIRPSQKGIWNFTTTHLILFIVLLCNTLLSLSFCLTSLTTPRSPVTFALLVIQDFVLIHPGRFCPYPWFSQAGGAA